MKFQEYLELSSSFLDASIEEGLAGKLPLVRIVRSCAVRTTLVLNRVGARYL